MAEIWSRWLEELAGPKVDTVLYISNGHYRTPSLGREGQRIIMLDPTRRAGLEEDECIRVLPFAVAKESGHAQLHDFNLSDVSSLRAPTKLKDIFPGLRKIQEHQVEAKNIVEILADIPDLENHSNCLVLEAAGEEFHILDDLINSDNICHFGNVIVRAGRDSYFEDSLPMDEVISALKNVGYRIRSVSRSDPDFPLIHFYFEPLHIELRSRETEIDSLKKYHSSEIFNIEQKINSAVDARNASLLQVEKLEEEIRDFKGSLLACASEMSQIKEKLLIKETAFGELALELERVRKFSDEEVSRLNKELSRSEILHADQQRKTELSQNDLRRAEGQIHLITELLLRGAPS